MSDETRTTSRRKAPIELEGWFYARGAVGERTPLCMFPTAEQCHAEGDRLRPGLGVVVEPITKLLVFPG